MCNICSEFNAPAVDCALSHTSFDSTADSGSGPRSAALTLPVYSVDQVAYQLTDGYWNNYGYDPAAWDVSVGGTLTYDISGLTAEGQQMALWAMEAWSAASGLQFAAASSALTADILFGDDYDGAYSNFAVDGAGNITEAYVNVSSDWNAAYGTSIDSYTFQAFIHELGHALGLGHAGNYNGDAVYASNGSGDNHYLNDSWQISIMSYFDPSENSYIDDSYAYSISPMVADLLAIQTLYGTNVPSNAGNTIYGANSNVGGYMGALFEQIFGEAAIDTSIFDGWGVSFTLFDTGGTDTVDMSGFGQNQRIDLREEAVSDVMGLEGNMSIARGTVIENALGGDGDDTIIGNGADNRLEGDLGSDSLEGGNGRDLLRGGAGNDRLLGQNGFDTLDGGTGNDSLYGGNEADRLLGGAGNDLLDGGSGRDRLFGDDGDDTAFGGDGDDRFLGGAGNDSFDGGADNDRAYGQGGDDLLIGGAGNDLLVGSLGFDTLIGGTGDDTLRGRGNADIFIFENNFGNDVITDFAARNNSEKIDLSGVSSITNFADLVNNHMSQVGSDVVIDALGGNTITLLGVDLADLLDGRDFIF